MVSVFTQVRTGQLPGSILYQDETVFVILSISPHNPGHTLVIPVEEFSDLTEVSEEVFDHLMQIARDMMRVMKAIYQPPRVALVAGGLEVSHTHLHVFSLFENADLDPSRASRAEPEQLEAEAERIKDYLKSYPLGGV